MTNQQHPITPPPELVQQWNEEAATAPMADQLYIATQAARWGADQELEWCVSYVNNVSGNKARALREARRPKPPSLAEEGLEALKRQAVRSVPSLVATNDCGVIRAALERLKELESGND